MRKRVAEFIADYLADNGIDEVFTVVGGGAMYLNNAFGQSDRIRCTYTHHEQAAALAAEGYSKTAGKMAAVCVTTGPGGTNALTGVLCAYQDNVPMIVISGQVRYETTVESTGLNLRQMGEQEYYIIKSVSPMTKYAVMVTKAEDIRKILDRAIYTAMEGRRGPVWIDVPLNIQSSYIETEELQKYENKECYSYELNKELIKRIMHNAQRPVIVAGTAIRGTGVLEKFKKFVQINDIPVVAATTVADIYPTSDKHYFGNFGTFGGRTGNFIIQNADVILALGCRMTYKHTGFNYKAFAPNAKKIVVDIDKNELLKNLINIDVPVHSDLHYFLDCFMDGKITADISNWKNYCKFLKQRYPQYLDKFADSQNVNPYYFMDRLYNYLEDDSVTVVGNSVACVSVLQMGIRKEKQRLFGNINCGTMGYDLPAAEGAARACGKTVICITGDGSIQMNIQELQTIKHNALPIKIFVFNNHGYQAIVQSQTNFFAGHFSGCTPESGISMPDFERLAYAYEFPYVRIQKNQDIEEKLNEVFSMPGYVLCELIQDDSQNIEPKVKSKQLEDGTLFSPPIDDLFPFLTEEEYKESQFNKETDYGLQNK